MVARRGKKPMKSGKKRKLKDLVAKGVTTDKARQVKGGLLPYIEQDSLYKTSTPKS